MSRFQIAPGASQVVDLEAQEPLHDGQGKADQVPGEVQGEASRDLHIEANRGKRVLDALVEVRLVGVKWLGDEAIREFLQPTALCEDVKDALCDHLAALEARVESTDDGLDVSREPDGDKLHRGIDDRRHPMVQVWPHDAAQQRTDHTSDGQREVVCDAKGMANRVESTDDGLEVCRKPDGDKLHRRVDDRRHPMVQVWPHDAAQQRTEHTRDGQREVLCDAKGDGHSLGKLDFQDCDDRHVHLHEGNDGLLEPVRVFDRLQSNHGLVVDKLVGRHLFHVGDIVFVRVNLVVFHACRRNLAALLPANPQVLPHVGTTELPGRFDGSDRSEVHAAEETQADAKDNIDEVHRQDLIDLVQLLADPNVRHRD
eukprot:CAMPEP_0115296674 /NCGR_PEP_ID=MMETSP0270-20121206/67355_2 /TAXON_ID=71861 /ORGANISM="Scrippsiella trochoidea, Strain CCMP3099" /LENGTH=368 /DNA_ID=CAMNT_0002714309 /DNA_START=56 /DNA_END=1159 /DNA_ORIENTATION=-